MHRFAAFVTAGLLGGWSLVAAQSTPQTPAVFHSTLVVTATLEPEPIERLSTGVDVVEAAEIAARKSELVVDLLRTLPGLAVAQSGSPGKVASLFVRGASSAQALVLYDGVPLNDPVLGAYDWSSLATEGLERIEVVRGPFSALWGSSAMGGVIQLVPRAAGTRFAALRVEAGEAEHRRASASAASPLGPLAVDLAGSLWRGDGELANDFFDGDELRARVEAPLGESWRIGALARQGEAEIGLPLDFLGNPSPSREQRSTSRLVALPFDGGGRDWQLEATLSRHATEVELSDPNDPFAASTNEAERDHGRLVVRRRFGDELWIAAGAERDRQTASTASAFGPGLDHARQTTDAFFAQGSFARGPLRLDLGVRRDEPSGFPGATSAKAGAVVALGADARLRASWGESFRAPSLGDLYFPFFGNPELEPERGESFELGVDLARGGFSAGVVGFQSDFDDLIQFDLLRGLPFNIGRARARGVEAEAEIRRGSARARANATWLDAEDLATGAPLPRRPELAANLLLAYGAERWDASATLRYVGEREDVGAIELAPYAAVDLAFSYLAQPRFAPYARLENALDRDYEEVAGFPAPGRRWIVGVALRTGP